MTRRQALAGYAAFMAGRPLLRAQKLAGEAPGRIPPVQDLVNAAEFEAIAQWRSGVGRARNQKKRKYRKFVHGIDQESAQYGNQPTQTATPLGAGWNCWLGNLLCEIDAHGFSIFVFSIPFHFVPSNGGSLRGCTGELTNKFPVRCIDF